MAKSKFKTIYRKDVAEGSLPKFAQHVCAAACSFCVFHHDLFRQATKEDRAGHVIPSLHGTHSKPPRANGYSQQSNAASLFAQDIKTRPMFQIIQSMFLSSNARICFQFSQGLNECCWKNNEFSHSQPNPKRRIILMGPAMSIS